MENDCNSEADAKALGKANILGKTTSEAKLAVPKWVNPHFGEDITSEVSNGNPVNLQRLWINPHFGEDNERSEVGSPEMGKSTFWGRHYERSESWQSR
jgi:hypothetical protein